MSRVVYCVMANLYLLSRCQNIASLWLITSAIAVFNSRPTVRQPSCYVSIFRFLTTLERHFKNISQGSFSITLDTLPSMMNAIRMVWVISRHYNTDERMVPLMELVAGEIAGKVRAGHIPTILCDPLTRNLIYGQLLH